MGILGLTSPQRSTCFLRVHVAAVANLLSFSEPCSLFLQKKSRELDFEGPFGVSLPNHTTSPTLRCDGVGEGPSVALSSPVAATAALRSGGSTPSCPEGPAPPSGPRAPRGYLAIVPAEWQVTGCGGNGCEARVVAHRARPAS